MKKLTLLTALLVCIIPVVFAQKFVNEFGKVSKDDMDFSFYPQDKTAEAVVIYDMGEAYFARNNDDFELVFEKATRIKVFKDSGKKWANIEIPLYRNGDIYEIVTDLEATAYNNVDGTINMTKLDLSTCHDEKINEHLVVKKFAIPDVKAGTVIEYKYKINSQYIFNFPSWEFQWKIPVIYSKYVTKMIPFYQYTWLLQGASKFDSQRSYQESGMPQQYGLTTFNEMVYEYIMKDLPAFNDEEFISTHEDYIMKINMQLSKVIYQDGATKNIMSTWPELIKDFLSEEDFGGYISKSTRTAPRFFDVKVLSGKAEQEKFDSIMNFVKRNFSWNDENGSTCSKNFNTFLKDKTGNNANLNLFALGLLKACGINAYPIILSTRNHGKIKYDYPFNHFFNYVCILVDVDGKKVLTDATNPLNSNNRIPEKCLNDRGLLIQKDKVEWVVLQSVIPSTKHNSISINLSDSTQNSKIETANTEYFALDYRNDWGDKIKTIKKSLVSKGYNVVDSSIVVKNVNKIKSPYVLNYKIEDKPLKINGKIYVSPFLNENLKENPLKQQSRTYPLDMIYPKKQSFIAEIKIPDGYKIDFIPEDEKIMNDEFGFDYNVLTNETSVIVNFSYYFKVPIYPAADYLKIKYYFKEIVNKGSEKIVFSKK
jgi:hypothetical protein